ncbi:MAG: DUF2802 domain-containing protein [Alteromonadaceae bacterium]|nr:DUF2802 domain-containing protein [Alteromonadaceae bacterium]
MALAQIALLAGLTLIILISFAFVLFFLLRNSNNKISLLTTQVEANELMLNSVQSVLADQQRLIEKECEKSATQVLETAQVIKQLEYRFKTLQEQMVSQKESLEQYQTQAPEDKLYTRALKLVELGADIDEIMKTCDIPQAEAEMLMAVHKKKD